MHINTQLKGNYMDKQKKLAALAGCQTSLHRFYHCKLKKGGLTH